MIMDDELKNKQSDKKHIATSDQTALASSQDTKLIRKLHRDMVKHQEAKRTLFIKLGGLGLGLSIIFYLLSFRGDIVLKSLLFLHSTPIEELGYGVGCTLLSILIALGIPSIFWLRFRTKWKIASTEFERAKIEYERHAFEIEGGELSFVDTNAQQGELSQSNQPGKVEESDHE